MPGRIGAVRRAGRGEAVKPQRASWGSTTMNSQAGQARPAERTRAWAESLDAFATAGVAAAEAATTDALRSGIACALCRRFADWVIVDLTLSGLATRSVASQGHQPELAALLEQMPAGDCPPIVSAMRRQTPVIKPFVTSPAELGVLPGGRAVAAALRAGSYAVGPVVSGGF